MCPASAFEIPSETTIVITLIQDLFLQWRMQGTACITKNNARPTPSQWWTWSSSNHILVSWCNDSFKRSHISSNEPVISKLRSSSSSCNNSCILLVHSQYCFGRFSLQCYLENRASVSIAAQCFQYFQSTLTEFPRYSPSSVAAVYHLLCCDDSIANPRHLAGHRNVHIFLAFVSYCQWCSKKQKEFR